MSSDLRYALYPWLVGKPVIDFIFVIIELFSLSLTVETYAISGNRSKSAFFEGGVSVTYREGARKTRLVSKN